VTLSYPPPVTLLAHTATVGLEAFPWHVHPEVIGIAATLVGGYWFALRRLGPRYAPAGEQVVTRRQIAWFSTGIAAFLLVEATPIHDIGEGSLYSVHMVEHLVLTLVFPPAILHGVPRWLMSLVVRPILPVLKVVAKPIVALLLFNAVIAVSHAPGVVSAVLTSELAHLTLHLALVGTAFIMWWPVIGPVPEIPKLAPFMAMGYLFLQSLVPTIPASFLTFAEGAVYDAYEALPRLWGLDVVTDQTIGGLIMKVGGGLVLWTAIAFIFFRWAFEEERESRLRPERVPSL
jgi:putative membrane protein